MVRVLGWAMKGLVAIVVIAVVGVVALLGSITRRGLPQTSGSIHVPGLHAAVTIGRDEQGILQIVAENSHDLFVAQGYAHAQERMWQMDVWRHISSGRLSELFGSVSLEQDRFIRTIGWREAAQVDLDAMPQDARDALTWYADGVNAWIADQHGSFSLASVITGLRTGTGGLDGYTPEPWTALDSAAWGKVQSYNLGGNMATEIFRLLADAQLGDPALTDSLFPTYDVNAPVITPSGLDGSGGAGATGAPTATAPDGGTVTAAAHPPINPDAAAGWAGVAALGSSIMALAGLDGASGLVGDHGIGSNNWVVSGSKSASGGALLANDPHLGFSEPSVWIMNGLHCREVNASCPYNVAGVSFPGVPGVILGHNAKIAWGATNVGPDVQDLFRETVDPADSTHYMYKGVSMPFETRTETIVVAGGDPETIVVRSTIHGPILNDVDSRLKDQAPLALRWTATAEPDGAFAAIFHLNTAATFDDFRTALRAYGSPSQNFVYADVDGHIGYQLPGLIPVRAGERTGDRIRDGASGTQDWTGYIPFDDLPWQYDPPSGFIVSANNAAVDASYPYFVSDDWDPGYRAQRITDLLTAKAGHLTTADLRDIQMDTHPLRADVVIPLLAEAAPTTADGQLVLERIRSWDRTCDVDSMGCAAYAAAEFTLMRAIFDDQLGPVAKDYVGSTDSWRALINVLSDPKSPWWNDATKAANRQPRDILSAALDRTGAELRTTVGQPSRWTWGRLHTINFREQTLGVSGIGPLEWYFNSGPRAVGGFAGAVQNNYYRMWKAYPDPSDPAYKPAGFDTLFQVSNGPAHRFTIDMSNIDSARIINSTGQSGNPFDRHYGDMIDRWATGQTVPLPFSAAAVGASIVTTLTLTP
ncbi:MAG: penicillin acylase family protein [Chloroflexota bacterium]